MVRQIKKIVLLCVIAVSAICTTAHAATHSVYEEGNLSSTYVTYFRDTISGMSFKDNYVAFRSGQYTYTMVVGDLDFNNGTFTLNENGKEYVYSTSSGYNSRYTYEVNEISNFSLSVGDNIIYSDLGDYPQLEERGAKYEILSSVLLCVMCISVVINRIFFKR